MGESELFPDTLRIDGLPHDRNYFHDHMKFVENYFEAVAGDQIEFPVIQVFPLAEDSVYTVPHSMWHYNYNTDQELLNQRLVELFVESIEASDVGEINYSDFDAFVIFHAGVGKDFSLGYDETPFDIPSAYISSRDLEPYLGRLPSGVTRGIILPEAENQKEALDFGVELSLNGIAVKLFGNWLGLPDLFDTETGRSGVGRWGMMDQGSGNVNAMVPAFPDAWSRVYMQWDVAQVLILNGDTAVADITYSIPRMGTGSQAEVLKIPVTPTEYYLLENRYTSADSEGCCVDLFDRDGRRMRMQTDGDIVEVEEGFRVAVRASEYDIGIPGSGILLWHIDEDVINAGVEDNRINVNREHRGVDLVEADGPQDIGYDFGFGSAGSGTSLGIPEDAWYADNRAHRDANGTVFVRFSDRTVPPARLYDGAFTYLELTGFSEIQDTMTFRARMTIGIPDAQLVIPKPYAVPVSMEYRTADLDGDSIAEIYAIQHRPFGWPSFDSLYISKPGIGDTIIAFGGFFSQASNRAFDIDSDGKDELLFYYGGIGVIEDSAGHTVIRASSGFQSAETKMFPARTESGSGRVLVVTQRPIQNEYEVWAYLFDGNLSLIDSLNLGQVHYDVLTLNIESFPSSVFAISNGHSMAVLDVLDDGLDIRYELEVPGIDFIRILNEPGRLLMYLGSYAVVPQGTLALSPGYYEVASGSFVCGEADCNPPQVDWNNDGIADGGGPYGKDNAPREDFPDVDRETIRYVDIDANGSADLVGFDDYRIDVALHENHSPDGFPIAVPGIGNAELVQALPDAPLEFVTVYEDSQRFVLSMNRLPVTARNAERFPFEEEVSIINVGSQRPQVHNREDWVYCWPNPTSDISYIRLTRAHAAEADVKIFDLAGRMVAELSGSSSIAGSFEIPWNVSAIESGVYIGRVKVSGGGTTEDAEIKIAVVK